MLRKVGFQPVDSATRCDHYLTEYVSRKSREFLTISLLHICYNNLKTVECCHPQIHLLLKTGAMRTNNVQNSTNFLKIANIFTCLPKIICARSAFFKKIVKISGFLSQMINTHHGYIIVVFGLHNVWNIHCALYVIPPTPFLLLELV